MVREQASEFLPIIKAFTEGKTIQYRTEDGWKDIDNPKFNDFPSEYRIKPESNYVPFINKEECWHEMHKHPDFGWVKCKETGTYIMVSTVYSSITTEPPHVSIDCCEYTFGDAFNNFCFTDGKPFGVKENL